MFSNIMNGIFGGARTKTVPTEPSPFAFLDTAKRGLARRTLDYIATGQDEEVLTIISTSWQSRTFNGAAAQQTNEMALHFGGNPEGLARYVNVRKAMKCGFITTLQKHEAYKEKTPEDVRILFGFFAQSRLPKQGDQQTTVADVISAATILGGSELDVVVYMLPSAGYSRPFFVKDLGDYWKRLDPRLFIEALERCDTKTRTKALETLKSREVMKSPDMLPFLFRQFEEGSAKLREAARGVLVHQDPAAVEDRALKALSAGAAPVRTVAVQILGTLGTPTARDALCSQREVEKSQAVLTAMDVFLNAPAVETETVENGYVDVHGTHVPFPDTDDLTDDGRAPLDADFLARLQAIEDRAYESDLERYARSHNYWVAHGKKGTPPTKPERTVFAKAWLDALNAPAEPGEAKRLPHVPWRQSEAANAVFESVLDQLPLRRIIGLACMQNNTLPRLLSLTGSALSVHVQDAIREGRLNLAQVIRIAREFGLPLTNGGSTDELDEAAYMTGYLRQILSQDARRSTHMPVYPGLWEVAAHDLSILAEALPPRSMEVQTNLVALDVIATFPSLPQALVQPVLFAAIDERTRLQKPAQSLLLDAPGIDDQLVVLLSDKRQGVRANAARFLADRQAKSALPAIVKRLKTEKSEMARAELISAVSRLDGDTAPYLGREALMKEATSLTAKLPNAKIDWLELKTAPPLVWSDGAPADPVLLDAWLRLALKLKSPLGSPLFDLYLSEMTPDSATAVADWVLDSWIAYDTYRPVGDAARAQAEKMAKETIANQDSWMVYVGYTEEQIIEAHLASMSSSYVNSAADSKGILALTHRATPSKAAPKIAAYLKQHGKRVSQAKALVETLYGMGSKDAVQVLVATATRFKQRTVRDLAESLVGELAERRGWTEDELADRSVPTGGFEEDGILALPVGEEAKPYAARLGSDLGVKLYNPDGKEVKSLPAGKDPNTKESKALLSAAKKTVKTVAAQQAARLYEAMLTPRVWDFEAWQADLTTHPIMRGLIERVIWRGLDADGNLVASLRPTAEGDLLNADGDDVDLSAIARIDIAHTANLDEADRKAWLRHLKDFEIKPLFEQVSRPVRELSEDKLNTTALDDRKGWMMTTFKLRSAAKKLGYDRGPIEDGGGFSVYRKEFRGAQIWADLHFTGSYVGEEDIPAAITHMQFTRSGESGRGRALPLKKVPPLLLSEVWNDMHEIAKSGSFDEEWQKKGLY